MKRVWTIVRDDSGATLPEYALLIALIAGVVIVVGQQFGSALQGMYTFIRQSLANN